MLLLSRALSSSSSPRLAILSKALVSIGDAMGMIRSKPGLVPKEDPDSAKCLITALQCQGSVISIDMQGMHRSTLLIPKGT